MTDSLPYQFEIIFINEYLVVIDKPANISVHRSSMNAEDAVFILQILRDQLKRHVFPVHRLDRATSGCLVFALTKDVLRVLSDLFQAGRVQKKYRALVRGWPKDDHFYSERPLQVDGKLKACRTDFEVVKRLERPWQAEHFPSSRYALLDVVPQTGRMHQIRRHLKHLGMPIVGDTTHGDGFHNLKWRENTGSKRLMLHASHIVIDEVPGFWSKLELAALYPREFVL